MPAAADTSPKALPRFSIEPHPTNPERAYLKIDCRLGCSIPLRNESPKPPCWRWDGNIGSPTITPSIDCGACGLHFTITKGVLVHETRVPNAIRR